MRTTFISIVLLAFVLTGCNDSKKETKITDHNPPEKMEAAHEDHEDHQLSDDGLSNAWTSEIETNEGAKWEANPETNEGVQKMQNKLNTIPTRSLEDYHNLASQLDEDKNYVIKNCTMKGASHDNLHVWLLPLIAKIDALSQTTSVDEAEKIKRSIENNVHEYSNYFE